jgi:hypothetical protein
MAEEDNHNIETLRLMPKTQQQVAGEYGISVNTLKSVLKLKGIELPKGLIFPNTQKDIYSKLGLPAGLEEA